MQSCRLFGDDLIACGIALECVPPSACLFQLSRSLALRLFIGYSSLLRKQVHPPIMERATVQRYQSVEFR